MAVAPMHQPVRHGIEVAVDGDVIVDVDPPRATGRRQKAPHELGLDYECRPILPRTGETQTQEYTELNPRQKVPLLQDGDFRIAESPAIAAYLSNTYGTRENALIPT